MKKPLINGILFVLLVIGLVSCYPGGAEYTSDTDIVITNYSDQFDFAGVKTYYLADSIKFVLEDKEKPDHSLDAFIISELEKKFDDLGWTRLDKNDISLDTADVNASILPDVAIVATIIKVTNYDVYYSYPWYPGWGWGWYYKSSKSADYWGYPGYGWGYYPYYPTYVSSYEVGTLNWRLFDPENVDDDKQIIYVEWNAAINGVLGSSKSSTKDRITKGIDQAFKQSPYLNGQ